jgi:hypothetical protein
MNLWSLVIAGTVIAAMLGLAVMRRCFVVVTVTERHAASPDPGAPRARDRYQIGSETEVQPQEEQATATRYSARQVWSAASKPLNPSSTVPVTPSMVRRTLRRSRSRLAWCRPAVSASR